MGQFIAGRFVLGFGASIASAAGPAYTVELAHPAYRGTMAGMYNNFWWVGNILAGWTTYGTNLNMADSSWAWRLPTLVQCILPGIVMSMIMFFPVRTIESRLGIYTDLISTGDTTMAPIQRPPRRSHRNHGKVPRRRRPKLSRCATPTPRNHTRLLRNAKREPLVGVPRALQLARRALPSRHGNLHGLLWAVERQQRRQLLQYVIPLPIPRYTSIRTDSPPSQCP